MPRIYPNKHRAKRQAETGGQGLFHSLVYGGNDLIFLASFLDKLKFSNLNSGGGEQTLFLRNCKFGEDTLVCVCVCVHVCVSVSVCECGNVTVGECLCLFQYVHEVTYG